MSARRTDGVDGEEARGLHRFFVSPEAVIGERVRFSESQAHQMAVVLRLRAGALVRAFDGVAGWDRVVRMDRLDARAAEGDVVGEEDHAPEPAVKVDVYPALLRRERFEQALQKLTEVGASSIRPVVSSRCVVRDAGDTGRLARWQAIVREATEQCGRGRAPSLQPALPWSEALQVAGVAGGPVLVAYEGERATTLRQVLRKMPAGEVARVSLFIGPEGGLEAGEVAQAQAIGATIVSLGPRILRAETASPVLTALVLYELERFPVRPIPGQGAEGDAESSGV